MMIKTQDSLQTWLQKNPFQSYAYSYPHKTAYRWFDEALPLQKLWEREDKQHLYLYLHIPFCEMRCGFCNLFTMANPKNSLITQYLDALERQAQLTKASLGDLRFSRLAIGGGTPTFLNLEELERVFEILGTFRPKNTWDIPSSCEMSPKTICQEKLSLLRTQGITRASIGVQSFLDEENKAVGRPQKNSELESAIRLMKDSGIPITNLDLIYGIPGQNSQTWQYSLEKTLDFRPEEVFLYPLYHRPLTGLDRMYPNALEEDQRWPLYWQGRDYLLGQGYEQVTMRLFRHHQAPKIPAPPYHSAEHGMLGLGVGARSYTQHVHYSRAYAVQRAFIQDTVRDFVQAEDSDFTKARYGVVLSPSEQRRRYIIKSLMEEEKRLHRKSYFQYFGTSLEDDFPQLEELANLELIQEDEGLIQLNTQGMAYSDVIAPWLYSASTQEQMQSFELK